MEENLSQNQQEIVEPIAGKGRFSVTFEDGTVIHESKDVDTFTKSLQKIGLKKVYEYSQQADYYLVSTEKITDKNDKAQIYIDGYYIYTQINNKQKIEYLTRLSEFFGENLDIEVYGQVREAKTKLRVTFPDDNLVIEKNSPAETFIAAVQHMDLWYVMITGIVLHAVPVVSRKMSERYPKQSTPINGFYVTYHGSNDERRDVLLKIAERLEKRIVVEIV